MYSKPSLHRTIKIQQMYGLSVCDFGKKDIQISCRYIKKKKNDALLVPFLHGICFTPVMDVIFQEGNK